MLQRQEKIVIHPQVFKYYTDRIIVKLPKMSAIENVSTYALSYNN